jgi:hypothetical protein
MLPVAGPTGDLSGITRGGAAISTSPRTVKGIEYAVFDAAAGDYTATYGAPPVDPPAPDTTITAFTVTANSARAAFTSNVPGTRFECNVDGAAFGACVSPAQLDGLAAGQHTFRVRAIDTAGKPDPTPAERAFTVLSGTGSNGEPPASGGESGGTPPGGGVLGAGPLVSDRLAPRVLVGPRRARVSAGGTVPLRVTCPSGEVICRVQLRLRVGSQTVAIRTLRVTGGTTRNFRLQLRRAARRRLARKGSLRVTAVATARDKAGNQATVRTAVRLLAPMRR